MWSFIANAFRKPGSPVVKPENDDMDKYLIACLGNIGQEYADTRHNIGFKIADRTAADHGAAFETSKLADRTEFRCKGKSVVVIKPSTYMNLSGKAVRYWLEKEKIPLERLLVVCDDLALPFGTFRVKRSGSDGGHNGLKSIDGSLGTNVYARFRFGIGSDFARGRQVDYVLGRWAGEEEKKMSERLEKASQLIDSFVLSGIDFTMNNFNGK